MNEHEANLRVSGLAVRFRQIGDERMRDLPFYNPALVVEAWDFSGFDDDSLIGVLITPWFMNLIVLPLVPEPIVANRYGESRMIALPSGEKQFLYGGDPEVGAFWAHSLHSPMHKFSSQMQARAEARLRLVQALTRHEPAPESPCNPGRRDLLSGSPRPWSRRPPALGPFFGRL